MIACACRIFVRYFCFSNLRLPWQIPFYHFTVFNINQSIHQYFHIFCRFLKTPSGYYGVGLQFFSLKLSQLIKSCFMRSLYTVVSLLLVPVLQCGTLWQPNGDKLNHLLAANQPEFPSILQRRKCCCAQQTAPLRLTQAGLRDTSSVTWWPLWWLSPFVFLLLRLTVPDLPSNVDCVHFAAT